MSRVCVLGLVVAVVSFVFVFEALAPSSDDAHADAASSSASATSAKPTPLLGVRLADLLRAKLGVDEWLATAAPRVSGGDDDDDDDDDDHDESKVEESDEEAAAAEADTDEADEEADSSWRALADVALVDRPDPIMAALFAWQRDDLQRWLQLLGVSAALQTRVREQLVQRNMSTLEFVSKRVDELAELFDDAEDERGVQLIALGNALLRTYARQKLVLEQCAKLLADGDDSAFLPDDVADVFAGALRFVVRVVVLVLKLLMAFAALIFFGPDGFGLAVLRILLRALAALMAVMSPLIRIAFPRFRFRIEENL